MAEFATFVSLLVLLSVSFAVIICDLRMMRIPDVLSGIVLVTFLTTVAPFITLHALMLQIAICTVVFALTFTAFFFRTLGGGDVKILSALSLFVPLYVMNTVLLVFSVALMTSSMAVVLSRRLIRAPQGNWSYLASNKLPMGVAIGITGICTFSYALIGHFS